MPDRHLSSLRDASPPATLNALLALTLCLTASVVACGKSGGSPGSGSSAGESGGTSDVVASTKKSGGKKIDVCAIVDAAKASQLTGEAVTSAAPETNLMANEYGCAYASEDDSFKAQITVFEHDAANSYATISSGSKNVTPVSGLGDKAFYDNEQTLYTIAGNTLIQINGVEGAAKCAAMARPVLAAL